MLGAGGRSLTQDVPTFALLHISGGRTCGSATSQGGVGSEIKRVGGFHILSTLQPPWWTMG